MEKLSDPPRRFSVPGDFRRCSNGVRLWRIYFRDGAYPTHWDDFRHFGPTSSRFDHHTLPKRVQQRGVLYAAYGKDAILTALAELFQATRHIDRHRNDPWLVAFDLAAPLKLLNTAGRWPVLAGGNMSINSGPRARARAWSRAIYASKSSAEGIWYPSSITNLPCVALYERAKHALPSAPSFHEALDSPKLAGGLLRSAKRLGYTVL